MEALRTRGWVTRQADGGPYALTPRGTDGHTAAAERVGVTRRRLMNGLTDDQYVETVRVLSRMAANLESASSAV
ncbi:hypothetical protein ABZS71_15515 [Streptomyces sp. NPDC005393]|uniref:hypothetical protein n=1 Tax=Streptomyces sp. NPDC005393 TaxID=3157041 RepID=UPI0033AA05FA